MVLNEKLPIPSVLELFRSIPNIRSEWGLKSPLQKWGYLYGIGKATCLIVQVPLFEEDQTLSLWAYQGCVYIGAYFILAIYTLYYHLIREESIKCLPCTCLLGLIIAILPFYFMVISKKRHILHKGVIYGGRYLLRNDSEDTDYNEICSKHMDLCMKNFAIRLIITSLGFIAMNAGLWYAFFVKHIVATSLDVRVPFTEEKSYEEFFVNIAIHVSYSIYGALAFVGMEIGMELFMGVVTISPKLIAYEFKKLGDKNEMEHISQLQTRVTFRNIVQQIMDIEDYKIVVRELIYWRGFLTPILFTYSIAMSIFCQYTLEFVAGYGIAVLCYLQLVFMCIAGEIFQDKSMGEAIYNSKWYYLPVEQQRDLMRLIYRQQNGVRLTIGPFSKLNLECCFIITKKIYSFIMFLLNLKN